MNESTDSLASQPAGEADASGYTLSLDIPPVADGEMTNRACAKLTLDDWLEPQEVVVFQITSGSAVFDDGTTEKVGPATDAFGRSYVTFTDTVSESGEMQAWMKRNPSVGSTAPYTFRVGQGYGVRLGSLTDEEPADGEAENAGRAIVTQNGEKLAQPLIVKFEFDRAASTLFDITKPAGYFQPDSSATVLNVKTHFDEQTRKDIADAYFHDTVAENVTLTASLVDHSEVPAAAQVFEFVTPSSPPVYGLALYAITRSGEVADGIAENLARAVISCSDATSQVERIVKFEFSPGSSATFNIQGSSYIQPNSTSAVLYVKARPLYGYHIAQACFADTSPEAVTVIASLVDHPEVEPQTQPFEFFPPPSGLNFSLVSLTRDGQPADGKAEIHARAIVTWNGLPPKDWTLAVRFLFMSGSPKFDTTKPTDCGSVQPNSTSRMLFVVPSYVGELNQVVADAYFTDTIPEWVILQVANSVGSCPATKFFTFYDPPVQQRSSLPHGDDEH